jgi:hypothetical protein
MTLNLHHDALPAKTQTFLFMLIHFLLSLTAAASALSLSGRPCCKYQRSIPPLYASKDELELPSNDSDDADDTKESWHKFPALESPMYSEERPRRLISNDLRHHQRRRATEIASNDWGVEHHVPPPASFPDTVETVADAAFNAISATLYDKQMLDPNVVQNAYQGDTVHGRRPVRNSWDAGRIGVEIDGAKYLFSGSSLLDRSFSDSGEITNADAVRRVALNLAEKLSRAPWDGHESEPTLGPRRPVVLYFNQIRQALAASYELRVLKKQAASEGNGQAYEKVTIVNLGNGATIPEEMTLHRPRGRGKPKHARLAAGKVDPTRGLLLVVQPSDYNDEYRPPGPAIGALESFQKLIARASVEEIPVVCLSPRFLANDDPAATSWDQSGYQQSATYGGLEPPRGPTPWLLRDFSPPSFCWVGNALELSGASSPPTGASFQDSSGRESYYSRISLMQSVMHKGHAWHMFAGKDLLRIRTDIRDRETTSSSVLRSEYQYLASTKSASGRPTREVMRRLFGEFAPYR